MADDIGDEPRFSQAQIRTIAQIVAAALAQDRVQNENTPPSSSQPVVEERQILDPVSDNQTSVGNTTPVENDVLKQLAELKERFDKMAAVKEKDPVTNFHITDSEEDVNEVGVQSLTRSGRVYNPESSVQAKGKEIVGDGTKKKVTEKGGEEPKQKKKEEEVAKGQKRTVEVGESSQNKWPALFVWIRGNCTKSKSRHAGLRVRHAAPTCVTRLPCRPSHINTELHSKNEIFRDF
ncbi:hypothetical protein JCGZ_24989 [Jatropha curcas]|uniref:Uncharacterized protein n=1 Tax=Jatropha curcas TaxID=180498 RepID=A0A067JM12_JATCU|nr:hypothetical protein JCGZ_24989 [Jatropha curcas]